MPTIVTSIIGSGAGAQFADPAAWWAAIPSDLVAADVVHIGKLQKQKFTGPFTFSAKTTSASCYPELTCEAGASYRDNPDLVNTPLRYNPANGAAIEVSAAAQVALYNQCKFLRVGPIQFASLSTATNAAPAFRSTVDDCTFDRILCEATSLNSTLYGAAIIGGARTVATDPIVIQRRPDVSAFILQLTAGAKIVRGTLLSLGATLTAGLKTQFASPSLEDTFIGGVAAPEDGAVTVTKTRSYTDATATGYATTSMAANFKSLATDGTHDVRLISGSTLDNVNAGAQIVAPPAGGNVAPVLSGATGTSTGSSTATGTVITDKAGGLLYALASTNASGVVAATIKAGQSQAVEATGTQNINFASLSPATTYYPWYYQEDAIGSGSNVVSGAAFTTAAVDNIAPTWPNGAAITPGASTSSSVTGSYPAASDANGVTYEKSKDGGTTWEANGSGLSFTFTGLAAGTSFPVRIRPRDPAGNIGPVLSASISTTAAATGSFKSSSMANDTLSAWPAGTAINWEWLQGGRIGSAATSVTRGAGTLASDRTLTVTGCPLGAGVLLASKRGANVAADDVYYEVGTVA